MHTGRTSNCPCPVKIDRKLRSLRIVVALAAFAGLNLFVVGLASPGGAVAHLQLLPAVLAGNIAVVAAVACSAVLFGRIYCSTICPLGVFQDFFTWLRRRIAGRRLRFKTSPHRIVPRAVCLGAAGAAIALGAASFAGWLDGYAWYGRMAAGLFRPAVQALNNYLADALAANGRACIFREEIVTGGACAIAVAAVSLAAIAVLSAWRGRLFCNTVCPTGTILAVLSAKSLFRVKFDAGACVRCGKCAALCKAECIDVKGAKVDQSRCVRCFDCIGECPKNALSFGACLKAEA